MNRLMQVGTVLIVITAVALVGAVFWAAQDGGVQETIELVREHRDMSTPSQEEVDLLRQGQFYRETLQVFLMDSELDEGECNTLSDLAPPLADRIADSSATVRDYAERLGATIEGVEERCQ